MTTRRDWGYARMKVTEEGCCRLAEDKSACDGKLEAAHVVERRFDPDPRQVRPQDIVPLCSRHHMHYDSRALDLLPYLSFSEQAAAVEKVGLERARRRLTGQREDV